MRILGENWEESWVSLCKFFLTYPNSVSVLISFVFILWIINEFKIRISNINQLSDCNRPIRSDAHLYYVYMLRSVAPSWSSRGMTFR